MLAVNTLEFLCFNEKVQPTKQIGIKNLFKRLKFSIQIFLMMPFQG